MKLLLLLPPRLVGPCLPLPPQGSPVLAQAPFRPVHLQVQECRDGPEPDLQQVRPHRHPSVPSLSL